MTRLGKGKRRERVEGEREGGKERQRREREEREGGERERGERESFLWEKWKFNQISFYSANRKSVLIKPKGNAKQPLEMEIVLNRQLRSSRVWDVYCAQTEQGGISGRFQTGICWLWGGCSATPSLAILPTPAPICL